MRKTTSMIIATASGLTMAGALAGPYSAALDDPANTFDAPIPGFVGPDGEGRARILQSGGTYLHPDNYVNPLFFGWADGWVNYLPSAGVAPGWRQPDQTRGPVTGDNSHIASLGDLNADQMADGNPPGAITLTFAPPVRNKTGADFVIFENGSISQGGAGVAGQIFGELAYVEVSSDGVNFARVPSRSLTLERVGAYGTVDATDVFGLAGKHANAYGDSWGTPFDLSWLAGHPLVTSGTVHLNAISHVRIVDVPGDGTFQDSSGAPIYDAWLTMGSGGLDLEAVGVVARDMDFEQWQDQRGLLGAARGAGADSDGDGIPNLLEYAAALMPNSPDPATALQSVSHQDDRLTLTFRRDERTTDLVLEVQTSSDLRNWETVALSDGADPLVAVPPHLPEIAEESASSIASIGVVREVRVSDVVSHAPRRFMRVRAEQTP